MSFEEVDLPSHRVKKYENEDISTTSPRELLGWYSYAVAAEVFAVVGVGAFLPLTLEQLARESGVLWEDKSTPCNVPSGASGNGNGSEQCVVRPFGIEVTTTSFAMYTSSAAVLVQAVTLVCFSSFADFGPYRKKLLLSFAYTGALACSFFLFVTPSIYVLGAVLVVISVTCLGSSFTLLNAFLPVLVSNSSHQGSNGPSLETDEDVELEPLHVGEDRNSAEGRTIDSGKLKRDLELSGKISSKGVGIGYAAAVFVELLSVGFLALLSKTTGISKSHPTLDKRLILLGVGIWWAGFTVPTALYLRPRPGPPLPLSSSSKPGKAQSIGFYVAFSLRSFWSTLKRATGLKQVVLFLISWFLLSDAIATISGTAVLFAKTELHMRTIPIALLSITSISSGILGSVAWPWLSRRYGLSQKQVILYCIALMEIIPLYGLLPYIPSIHHLGFLGLQKPWEIYPIGVLHGFVMGGLSSYCRSFFGHLIPPGSETAFFALYAVTDKGSSAVGPAVVASIVDKTGGIRAAFIFLSCLVVLPGVVVWFVDVEKGRADALRMVDDRIGVDGGSEAGGYEPVSGQEVGFERQVDRIETNLSPTREGGWGDNDTLSPYRQGSWSGSVTRSGESSRSRSPYRRKEEVGEGLEKWPSF
ncbi:hypothetical protein GQ43DRAFT_426011 [Delitschia confertaspora ATCC 74209]|uniref:Autophagy-related protein n=1 Tax=Delitschia confertaspora ATCC 74209 TaxID=1513339 RepID=A0A9P4ML60_9PLEO|nr:hypothetical protein GQ43DRAFT_426011 [Delitschia confertaspora ATCC 74209]